tara:strand:- start:1405 stop:1614 length:210 start_codon:yes stop_codon:yes gene_type:complete
MLKRGRLELINNLDAKQNSNNIYFRVLVKTEDGWKNLMLTKSQVDVALDRACKNPEDEIQPTWLDKLIK